MKTNKAAKQPKNRQPYWTAKVGSVRVKVYEVKTGPARQYKAFCVADYSTGTRKLRKFADVATAKAEAARIATAIANGQVVTATVTTDDAVTLHRARATIAPLGLSFDAASELLAAAAGLVGVHQIVEACRDYAKRFPLGRAPKPLAVAIDEFLADKRAKGLSDRKLSDYRSRLGWFAHEHPGKQLADFSTGDLQAWIDALKKDDGSPMTARTRLNFSVDVSTFFKHHQRRGAIAENPMDNVEREKPKNTGDTEFWTPEEASKILAAAEAELVAPFAIGLFSGLRSAEIGRIVWREIDLVQGHVLVRADNAKTASRRLAPLPDNLRAWLAGRAGDPAAKVWPHSPADFIRAVTAACLAAGVRRVSNGSRHSFISYRCALLGDLPRVALEAGNSPGMLHRHYRGLATADSAKTYFSIAPTAPANVVQLTSAA